MTKFLLAPSLFVLLGCSLGHALTPVTPASTARRSTRSLPGPARDFAFVSLGPGMPVAGGDVGIGVNTEVAFRVLDNSPLFVGLDLNYYHVQNSYFGTEVGLSVYEILAAVLYRMPMSARWNLLAGASVGPAFARPSADVFSLHNKTMLAFLLRPGAEFRVARNFSVSAEARMGVAPSLAFKIHRVLGRVSKIDSTDAGFYFGPQISATMLF